MAVLVLAGHNDAGFVRLFAGRYGRIDGHDDARHLRCYAQPARLDRTVYRVAPAAEEPMVCRLSTGGNRIRTIGPA